MVQNQQLCLIIQQQASIKDKSMQFLGRMNAKMDEGYKMTNFYCSFCRGVTLAKPNDLNEEGYVYCPKCNKEYVPVRQDDDEQDEISYKIQQTQQNKAKNQQQTPDKFQQLKPEPEHEEQSDLVQAQYNQFLSLYNSTVKTEQQLKSEKASKKMGEKLIAGWAMMEDACQQCNVPLMKSRKGNMICCGCDRDYMKVPTKPDNDNTKKQIKQEEVPAPKYSTQQQSKVEKVPPKPTQSQPSQQNQHKVNQPQKQSNPNLNEHRQLAQNKISELSLKTLEFLEKRLEQAFQLNDLEAVDRVLRSIKAVKQLL